jgi:cytochrome bd-type quinol oxidase subunit 1
MKKFMGAKVLDNDENLKKLKKHKIISPVMNKVYALAFFFLISFYIIFFLLYSINMDAYQLEYDTHYISKFIVHEAEDHLSEDIFFSKDYDRLYLEFDRFFGNHLFFYNNIMRIKIWDLNGTILYSDNPEFIGKNYRQNENFQRAIQGETVSHVEKQDGDEDEFEIELPELTEIYVPIQMNNKIVGVIEVYKSLVDRNNYIKNFKERYLMLMGVFLILAIISLYFFRKDLEKLPFNY